MGNGPDSLFCYGRAIADSIAIGLDIADIYTYFLLLFVLGVMILLLLLFSDFPPLSYFPDLLCSP
jgi:hypothetical protein